MAAGSVMQCCWVVCALCAAHVFGSFVTLSIARAPLEPCHGPGTAMRISSRCIRRCAFCLHAGGSCCPILRDLLCRAALGTRAVSLRGVVFGLWALPHAGLCVLWSLQCMVRAGVLVWPREGSNFWSRWTSDGILIFYESGRVADTHPHRAIRSDRRDVDDGQVANVATAWLEC